MPQYRKLSTRTPESFDFNDLPDDFTRLTWLQLPLVSCRDGRGIDIPGWLIGRLYPLRQDVTPVMIDGAMSEFEARGMVTRYSVDGRPYYQIVNWTKYQGSTDKEAISPYPAPNSVGSWSGVGRELVGSKSALDADADAYSDADTDAEGERGAAAPAPALPPATSPDFQDIPPDVKRQKRRARVDELLEPSPVPDVYANAPPVMTLLHRLTGFWPGENKRDELIAQMGEQPDEPTLTRAVTLWDLAGHKLNNFLGISDWYQELLRDPDWTPGKRFKSNGRGPGSSSAAPPAAPPLSRSEEAAAAYATAKRAVLGGSQP